MNKPQHTPTPLYTLFNGHYWELCVEDYQYSESICSFHGEHMESRCRYVANCVNLMPEMIEALECVQRLDYFQEHNFLAEKVRKVLAKAKAGSE